jgi:transcriptional regulator with GAF, ATPase, and Fis domain
MGIVPQTDGFIGSGETFKKLLLLIDQVAVSNSTVLLSGETGTGKELVAGIIHERSRRREMPMIKVNCAALPAFLVESELFGHERGSFTGATDKRIGKFEQAHKGTLFLDEIGDMPMEMQVKLLRAIQEKEIERIGSKTIIKTDVRIIAATNRHLESEVIKGRFRDDLYYRLNVFPMLIAPLRERREDIPLLVNYFLKKHSIHHVKSVSPSVLNSLSEYDWPGNIRELEHMIERAVLTNSGNIIDKLNLPGIKITDTLHPEGTIKTIDEVERDHILFVLKKSKGKVRGYGGAAELLKIPPSTLQSKMKKLGIRKVVY